MTTAIVLSNSFLVTYIDDEEYDKVEKYTWYLTNNGYVAAHIQNIGKRTLHRYLLNLNIGDKHVDHINHNKLDNQKNNLRTCTNMENHRNKKSKPHSSIYKGVCWVKANQKWASNISVEGKNKEIGLFENEIDAAHAYDYYALKFFGNFAYINFPDYDYNNHQIICNRKSPKTSKFKYISLNRSMNMWFVTIRHNKKAKHLGAFRTELDALLAYNQMAKQYGLPEQKP